jgi:lipopolysaccharide/colanic/teichoic acid biosynthesis glycosyltransferase
MRDVLSHHEEHEALRDTAMLTTIRAPSVAASGGGATVLSLVPDWSEGSGGEALAFSFPDELARSGPPLWYIATKRVIDVVGALTLLLILVPVFLAIIIAMVTETRGPIFFVQRRCGRGGSEFPIMKFRTMVVDADQRKAELVHLNEVAGPMFKMRRDPRVTIIGYWLRKFSLDELPQLVNVLRGEMSLVGPRPSLPREVASFTEAQRRRLSVKPGLTCLWQVSGRSDLTFEQWIALDEQYIREQSLWLDVRIMARTIPAVISGRGAY